MRSRSSARSVRRTGRCARLSAADGSSTASPPRRPLCGSARCTWPSLRGALHVCRRRPLHAASVRSGVTSAVSPSHGWLPNVPHHRSPSRFASRRPQGLSHRAPSPQFAVLHSGHCRGTETAIRRGCLLQGSAYVYLWAVNHLGTGARARWLGACMRGRTCSCRWRARVRRAASLIPGHRHAPLARPACTSHLPVQHERKPEGVCLHACWQVVKRHYGTIGRS